jgi:hypothetical protein
VSRDRPGDEEKVGVPGRGDEVEAKPLDIVEAVVQGMHLQLAAVAGTGIDHPDRPAPAEDAGHFPPAGSGELCRVLAYWRQVLGSTTCSEEFF